MAASAPSVHSTAIRHRCADFFASIRDLCKFSCAKRAGLPKSRMREGFSLQRGGLLLVW
jgi:hypothetical protein